MQNLKNADKLRLGEVFTDNQSINKQRNTAWWRINEAHTLLLLWQKDI